LPDKLAREGGRLDMLKRKKPLQTKTPLKVKKVPKKQVKPNVAKLKKKADAVFSKYIRLRDNNTCITCGTTTGQMQCGHFMSRRYNATRYDEENCNCQCYRCNVLFYGEQYKYSIEIDLKYGDGAARKLAGLAKTPHQFTVYELQEIIDEYEGQVEWYEKAVIKNLQ
jgi:NinG protein